jgi:hypothetical protein
MRSVDRNVVMNVVSFDLGRVITDAAPSFLSSAAVFLRALAGPQPPALRRSHSVLGQALLFVLFRRVRKIAISGYLASSYLSVCLSVRTEQLGSHWTDFHEI